MIKWKSTFPACFPVPSLMWCHLVLCICIRGMSHCTRCHRMFLMNGWPCRNADSRMQLQFTLPLFIVSCIKQHYFETSVSTGYQVQVSTSLHTRSRSVYIALLRPSVMHCFIYLDLCLTTPLLVHICENHLKLGKPTTKANTNPGTSSILGFDCKCPKMSKCFYPVFGVCLPW